MQHDDRLDGIRGLAVLLVLFHHGLQNIPIRNPIDFVVFNAAGVCWVGVDLFFVLSGFLITGILLRNREGRHYFSSFYARRILRIFPLYFVLLPPILILSAHYGGGWPRDASYDALYLSNLHNAIYDWPSRFSSHLWSLSVEEQFYVVWPLLILLTPARWTIQFLLSLETLLILVRIAVSAHLSSTAVYNLFHLDGLLCGALLAAFYYRGAALRITWLALAFFLSLALLVFPPQVAIGLDWQHWAGYQTISYALLAIIGAALIAITKRSSRNSWLSRFFSIPLMTAFGRFSYSIYLVHYPLDTLVRNLGLHPGVQGWAVRFSPIPSLAYTVLLSTASFGLAQVTWHFLEKRCLSLKRFFEYDR